MRDVAGRQRAPVDADAGPPPHDARGHSHLDLPASSLPNPEHFTRVLMTQHRAGPAAQNGSNEDTMTRELRPPDGVHTAMYAVQPSAPQSVFDSLRAQAQLQQLRPSNHPMLPRRQREHALQISGFAPPTR
jgi:hypothetical protein